MRKPASRRWRGAIPSGRWNRANRRGTQALIANFDVVTEHVIHPTIGNTRTEEDFAAHIRVTVDTDPYGYWVFNVDQLNTHKSAGLVRLIAELCHVKDELGVNGQSGILKDMASRAAFLPFLQDPRYRIYFVYTL